jgi:hypothetical protein
MVRRCIVAKIVIAAFLALSPPASAEHCGKPGEPDRCWTANAVFENDLFGGKSDRHYTHGSRIALTSSEDRPGLTTFAEKYAPLFRRGRHMRATYSLGQNIYTPDDIARPEPIRNDQPYAGWTYVGIGAVSYTGDDDAVLREMDHVELNLGVVGPSSGAEAVQKFVHKHTPLDARTPRGWDNQLKDEPGAVLTFERQWLVRPKDWRWGPFAFDVAPHLGGALSNVHTYGATGLTLRFGEDLPNDYGPPRIRPSLPGSDFFRPRDGFGWYLFAGVEGRAVARNIFLDGNSFRDSHSVDKEWLVGDMQAGIEFTIGSTRISFTQIFRSREFDGQQGRDHFGALNFSFRFRWAL